MSAARTSDEFTPLDMILERGSLRTPVVEEYAASLHREVLSSRILPADSGSRTGSPNGLLGNPTSPQPNQSATDKLPLPPALPALHPSRPPASSSSRLSSPPFLTASSPSRPARSPAF
ncbi:hypothetical protein L211DRAFT_880861 [Terfezia boudieri ATCC MYA-4762]|uniref:Uncharacterized protein n=1 Tax=Terfezia boudieri ATCC MYA-4762 TaxID=1051890 RepID=A0A3N4LL42_9PEZI|nr:hypothetical protein L211DRAFT_880861 [Terfezia boudieri ATCC MYA-4762]